MIRVISKESFESVFYFQKDARLLPSVSPKNTDSPKGIY